MDKPQQEKDGFELQELKPADPVEEALANAIQNNSVDLVAIPISTNYVLSEPSKGGRVYLRDEMNATMEKLSKSNEILALFIAYKPNWMFFRVRPQGSEKYEKHEPYEFWKSGDSTVMIVSNVDKNKDKYATAEPPDAKLLYTSEIQYQGISNLSNLFPHAATQSEIDAARLAQAAQAALLRYIWQYEVSNVATRRTVTEAYKYMGWDVKSPRIFKRNSDNETERKCFDALLRTVNVKSVNRELLDHHRAFGNKRIQSITVIQRYGAVPQNTPFYLCSLIIEIGA